MSLILRETKGSKLTIAEMDGNLTYLDNQKSMWENSRAELIFGFTGLPTEGDLITLDNIIYEITFGGTVTPGHIKVDLISETAIDDMVIYHSANAVNSTLTRPDSGISGNVLKIIARIPGTSGNTIATSTTSAVVKDFIYVSEQVYVSDDHFSSTLSGGSNTIIKPKDEKKISYVSISDISDIIIGLTGSGETFWEASGDPSQIQPINDLHIDASIVDNIPEGYWEIDGQPVATFANYTGVEGLTTTVTLTADVAGEVGNDISITGEYSNIPFFWQGVIANIPGGTSVLITEDVPNLVEFNVSIVKNITLGASIIAHNASNPTQTVTLIGDDTQMPSIGSILTLTGIPKQIGILVVEWNIANPLNTITFTAGEAFQELTIGVTLTLSGGNTASTQIQPIDGLHIDASIVDNIPNDPKKLTNRIYISPTAPGADYTTIDEAVTWFNANATVPTEFILDGGVHIVVSEITIENVNSVALNVKGLGSDVTGINASFAGNLFLVKTEVTFSRVSIGGDDTCTYCFEIATDAYCEFYDIIIGNFNGPAFLDTNNGDVFVFNFIVDSCTKMYEVNNALSGGAIDLEVGTITNCPIGVHLFASTAKDVIINGLYYYGVLPTNDFIRKEVAFGLNGVANISNCGGNSIGNFQTGFDFALIDGTYADVEMIGNTNYESKNPHFKVNVTDNTGVTTCTDAGVFYKANFENGDSYTCKMKLEDNKYTFLSNHKKDMAVFVTGNISVDANARTITIGWKKNGEATIYSPMSIRTVTANQPYSFSFTSYFQDLEADHYGEIFLSTLYDNDVVTIQDLNIFGMTI